MTIDYRQMAMAMKKDPRYAQHIYAMLDKQEAQKQSNQLVQAYARVEQSLMDAEAARRQQFENTPSDVPVPMRPPEYQAPSPLAQWRERNAAMMASGNPTLQGLAIEKMKKGFDASKSDLPSAIREYQYAQSQGYEGSFKDWKDSLRDAGTTIDLGGKEYVNVNEANGLRYKPEFGGGRVEPYTPKSALVGKVIAETTQEQKDKTQEQKSKAIVGEMESMLFGENGIYKGLEGDDIADRVKFMATSNLQQLAQTDPRFKNYVDYTQGTLAPLAKSLGQAGSLSDTDLALVQGLIPKITGINPDSPEVAIEKLDKLNRLISAGQEKGKITTEMLDKVLGRKPSVNGDIIPNSQPIDFSKVPVGKIVSDGQFEYMRTPDGEIKRRAVK